MSDKENQPSSEKLKRIGLLVGAAFLGSVVGLIGLLVFTAAKNRGRLPALTPERFYEAKEQWARNAVPNYDITVVVYGRQAATYRVIVRNGEVENATRDEVPLRQRRTMGTWSVPGMFGTMQSDIDNLEKRLSGTADESTPQVELRGVFDANLGYPQRYHRTEFRKWGTNAEVSWEVTQFVDRTQ